MKFCCELNNEMKPKFLQYAFSRFIVFMVKISCLKLYPETVWFYEVN